MTSGPISASGSVPGPTFSAAHARRQPLDQRVADVADRDRDGDRHAALACRAVSRAHQRVGRLVEVGVGHHDHVVLRAAQRLHPLAVRACRSR